MPAELDLTEILTPPSYVFVPRGGVSGPSVWSEVLASSGFKVSI